MGSPVSRRRTCVPTGTWISRSSPRRPCFPEPWPCTPRWARKCDAVRNRPRSRRSALAASTTSPPSPPSPPSGPPLGTYFSRRKLTQPSPPRPPSTWMVARSANTAGPNLRGLLGQHADVAAAVPAREGDRPTDFREDGIVAPEPRPVAGVEAGATLAHDDRAGRHRLACKHLDAEPLSVRVATVLRGAEALLMRHRRCPPWASWREAFAPAWACRPPPPPGPRGPQASWQRAASSPPASWQQA